MSANRITTVFVCQQESALERPPTSQTRSPRTNRFTMHTFRPTRPFQSNEIIIAAYIPLTPNLIRKPKVIHLDRTIFPSSGQDFVINLLDGRVFKPIPRHNVIRRKFHPKGG